MDLCVKQFQGLLEVIGRDGIILRRAGGETGVEEPSSSKRLPLFVPSPAARGVEGGDVSDTAREEIRRGEGGHP